MKRFFNHKIILFLILVLASVLRIWQLGVVPPSPDWDEAALGYNAYSILKTGMDEYGTKFPLSLRSYDDYKPPLYVYLTVPSVALFGLDTWAVRLPSVVMGILAVFGTFFLVNELMNAGLGTPDMKGLKTYLPLIAAFLLAISPWHIQFSRIAFEANTGVTLNIWGIYAFLRGRKSGMWLSLSAFFFGLSLYAYHSERVFVPMLVILLTVLFWKELWKNRRSVVMGVVVGLLTILPAVTVFLNPSTLVRLKGTSSLADQTGLLLRSTKYLDDDIKRGDKFGLIFDNRRIVWAKTIFDGYLSHYSLRWLFLSGDNPRHHAPDMGLLYLWELPLLLVGMLSVWKRGGKVAVFLFGWFCIAPIPASVTTELPHAIRTLVFLPVFQIFTAAGIIEAIQWIIIRKKNFNKIKLTTVNCLLVFYLFFIVINIVYYIHMYFVHQNPEFSEYWQYGYKQAVQYSENHKSQYKKIVVSTELEQPHMFFLFYTKYDPKKYLAEGGTSSGGFAEVRNKFDIYEFRPINWNTELKDGTILYIGLPEEIPNANLSTIRYLDGTEAMRIADR